MTPRSTARTTLGWTQPSGGSTPRTAMTVPAPTIHTMIVCVPVEVPGLMFDQRTLEHQFGVHGVTVVRFWAKPCQPLRRRQLIDPRKGKPTPCAGGSLRMLDMAALRRAYRTAAAQRYQTFTTVVRGTRDARPWAHYLGRHLSEPDYRMTRAESDYRNQPRVLALRAHNAVADAHAGAQLDERELEMFQAGPAAYGNYHHLLAMAADALLTPERHRLCPVSDRFADRLTYLQQANRYLDTTNEHTRIVAVQLTE